MKNIEKYEEEIKKEIANFRDIPCIVKDLKDGGCGESRNCVTCSTEMLHWLSQEYEEPILTDEEKKILNQLIVANSVISNKKLVYVQKVPVSNYSNKSFLLFRFEDSNCVYTTRFNTDCIFKRMEEGKKYILEELGL